ncbi:hypothetical protein EJC49_17345 [Aquibium carbonis]|uniref:Uncharacterized protein n=1 Tax=Aquibium carbonis TaxID=2495581 RepID=A0A429YUY5_9HYPH|nr:hypothetical protein EJC49_17345 [Aquibium carbonis]
MLALISPVAVATPWKPDALRAPDRASGVRCSTAATPTPYPSPQGGGGWQTTSLRSRKHQSSRSPSPLWGGVRGGGRGAFNEPSTGAAGFLPASRASGKRSVAATGIAAVARRSNLSAHPRKGAR